ncbi:MAG: DUF1489 domain-containing protein [Pseudomonadota bacterium]
MGDINTSHDKPGLHLIKLCVGSDGPDQLAAWQAQRMAERRAAGLPAQPRHVTRMWPRRADEIAGSGSLFWVFRGVLRARQGIIGFEAVRGEDGLNRCAILLDPRIVPVSPRPRRAFQGWRYLPGTDAPPDLARAQDALLLPETLEDELQALGVF